MPSSGYHEARGPGTGTGRTSPEHGGPPAAPRAGSEIRLGLGRQSISNGEPDGRKLESLGRTAAQYRRTPKEEIMAVKEIAEVDWLGSLEEAQRRARETGKPIFLDFFSPT